MTSPDDALPANDDVRAQQETSPLSETAAVEAPAFADASATDSSSFENAETAPLDEPQSPDNGQTQEIVAPAAADDVASFDADNYSIDAVADEPAREPSPDVEVRDELITLDRRDNVASESGTEFVPGVETAPVDEIAAENEAQTADEASGEEHLGDDSSEEFSEEEFGDDAEETYESDDDHDVSAYEETEDDEVFAEDDSEVEASAEDEEYSEEEYAEDGSEDESDDDDPPPTVARGERLQKILAAAGVDSRRQCEELITAGRVEVDGEVVTTLGTRAIAGESDIRVDGTPIKIAPKIYYAINKPKNVLCTTHDPSGRARVVDLLPNTQQRLFTVGRLDKDSEGLIIVTNDGELAQRLMHPKFGVEKTYKVQIAGVPERELLQSLLDGVRLAEGLARAQSVKLLSTQRNSAWLEIVLTEGRNREIRRILAKVGHKVMNLQRIAVGPIRLKLMAPGEFRRLTQEEVTALWKGSSEKRKRRPAMKTVQGKFLRPSGPRFGEGAEVEEFDGPPVSLEGRTRRDRGDVRAAYQQRRQAAGEESRGFGSEERPARPRKPNADGGFIPPSKNLARVLRPAEDESNEG
ncbi:MAG TPA: pseudouridine synthase, partial [Pirellulales bacterium]